MAELKIPRYDVSKLEHRKVPPELSRLCHQAALRNDPADRAEQEARSANLAASVRTLGTFGLKEGEGHERPDVLSAAVRADSDTRRRKPASL